MAAKSTYLSNALLALILNQTAIANLAQNGTSPITSLWLSLHTASPGASGNQSTNEAAYTSYARTSVARTSAGFTVAAGIATLTSAVNFPQCTGGAEVETYVGVGQSSSGAGNLFYFGPLSPTISVSNGTTPQLTTGTTVSES